MNKKQQNAPQFSGELDINLDGSVVPAKNADTRRSIGRILIDAGVISQNDALKVIAVQREKKIRFGEAALLLGLISEGDIRYALSYQYEFSYLPRSSGKVTNPALVAAYIPFSHEVDQLRNIRSQLKLRWFDKPEHHSLIAIVGADRAEGGSYLAANLAIVFAQMGERTLLIDADMRAPKQHSLFQLNNQLGFSSLLAGRSDVTSSLHKIGFLPNLHVLPVGPIPPNPLELLNRNNLTELFNWANSNYDVVLIDTPALSSGPDAMLIASKAKAAIAVARANSTNLRNFTDLIDSLKQSSVNIVGTVLNNPPLIDVAG